MGKRKKILKFISITMMITVTIFGAVWGISKFNLSEVKAAQKKKETVEIRIIGTTDLHGQVNSKDYEQGVDYNNGGLARVYDLVQTTRSEMPGENIITLDAGDFIFDFTTDYIHSDSQDTIQPIIQAMSKMGYDAITLGNHEFDYGYEYLLKQLNGSGLRDITVVSNVTDSKTGEHPFLENMLITRQMKTSAGNEVEVMIGIIGQTIPTLTAKTHSYIGILDTEDMVLNAEKEAAKLKEMGADIIVALSHTGIGPEEPELNFKNVAYALTKIEDIDVVVCGHEHNLFPTTDMTSPYYTLPNVDKKTYLMNGTNVIMAGNRGEAIGVVDLTLEISDEWNMIIDRHSELRMVTAENTTEDETIANLYAAWDEKLSEYSTKLIGELEAELAIQNFYGLLGDNYAIQLLNDSKIDYALRYINTSGKSYQDYPVISASTYYCYGTESIEDFVNIKGQITEASLAELQPYNSYLYLYTISGKQLKEWLEWSASAYETVALNDDWSSGIMTALMKETKLKSLIREEWLNDWSNFYIFDGIDYVINPSVKPRYDISGNQISNNIRVKSVQYNGTEVSDDMIFVLATNKITKPVQANRGVENQTVYKSYNQSQSALSQYVNRLYNDGSIVPQVDYNWSVSFPRDYQFIVKSPYYAHDSIKNTPWYVSYLTEIDQYRYYIASYPEEDKDEEGPHIVATSLVTKATGTPYEVVVKVSDESEIKYIRYMSGDHDIDDKRWYIGKQLNSHNGFTVSENDTYTIYAEDVCGNKSVRKVVVTNFSDELLGKPTFATYTNRKSKISGLAEPGATIVFDAYTGTYEGKVGSDGKFAYPLPSQPSGTEVIVYVKDEERGVESEWVSVTVKRTGPNQPSIDTIRNNSGYISGVIEDSDATVIAIIDDTVYVSDEGGKELYELNTEIYDASLDIVEVPVSITDSGYYFLRLPPQAAGKTVTVYGLDHVSRNSRINTETVVEEAPNAPYVYEVSNIEKSIVGYVPVIGKTTYTVTLAIEDNTYETTTDEDGKFSFEFQDQLYTGQQLTVTAKDYKNGSVRSSYPTKVVVNDIESYVRNDSTNLTLEQVTSKSFNIIGYYYSNGKVWLATANGKGENFNNNLVTVETDYKSKFSYSLESKLKGGTTVYAMIRFTDGKILYANKVEVQMGRPDIPSLLKEVTNNDKLVQVVTYPDCEVVLTIGSKTYATSDYQYDELTNQYIYDLETDRDISGTPITVTATNISGTSDMFTSKLVKVAPDSPMVNPVKTGEKVVTGTIELLDYTPSISENEETEQSKVDEVISDNDSKVEQTQTKIYAKIGSMTYVGTIDNKGNFEIVIPEQEAGTGIKVWGKNKAGRGPLIKVIVVE